MDGQRTSAAKRTHALCVMVLADGFLSWLLLRDFHLCTPVKYTLNVLFFAKRRSGMNTLASKSPISVVNVETDETHFTVFLNDGRRISVPLEWYPRLYYGTVEERKDWRPFGFENRAIAWDSLDEHISVEGLLDGRPSSESPQSIQRWLLSRGQKHENELTV